MKDIHKTIVKAISCGSIISLVINFSYILSLYVNLPNKCYYALSCITAILVIIMLKGHYFKETLFSVIIMIISSIFAEAVFSLSGITSYFYYMIFPTATEIAIGEGVMFVFLYIFGIIGVLLGISFISILACIKAKRYRDIYNQYLSFIINKNFWFFNLINLFVMLFTHKMLKLDKTKKYYAKLFSGYIVVNLCSCLVFYLVVYGFWIVANIIV